MFNQIKRETFHVLLNANITFSGVILELFLLADSFGGFDSQQTNAHQERLSVFVDDIFGFDFLDDTLVIFFNELD